MLKPSDALLKNKVAIVTGGGGGIGKAISLAFAAYGARVIVAENNSTRANETVSEIQEIGAQAIASVVDVMEPDKVAAMSDTAFNEFGQIDILVNNVGDSLRLRKSFIETNEDDWEDLYKINLKHVFLCTKAVIPSMIARGDGGSIINVTTVEAFRAAPEFAVYSAFKSAVTQFTKTLAMEVAKYGIRVNAVAPDMVSTIHVALNEWIPEEQKHLIPLWVPIGRLGVPDDVAGVAVFLASDLSRYVTGTTVHADGGTYAAGGWYRTKQGTWTVLPAKP